MSNFTDGINDDFDNIEIPDFGDNDIMNINFDDLEMPSDFDADGLNIETEEPKQETKPVEEESELTEPEELKEENKEPADEVEEPSVPEPEQEEQPILEPEVVKPKEEEKPKKRTRRTRKAKAEQETAAAAVENTPVQEEVEADTPINEVVEIKHAQYNGLQEVIDGLELLPDNDFAEAKKMIDGLMAKIEVRNDMDTDNVKLALEQCDELESIITPIMIQYNTLYDNILGKGFNSKEGISLIAQIRKSCVGKNSDERDRQMFQKLASYKMPNGVTVNLLFSVKVIMFGKEYFDKMNQLVKSKSIKLQSMLKVAEK